jgi:guanylate kinase
MGRFIILSGPSCIGKGPLCSAVAKFYPEISSRLKKLVRYNSRSPRPSEVDGRDYYFRTRNEIEAMKQRDNFVVLEVRGDLQAVDMGHVGAMLEKGDLLYEGNPAIGRKLQEAVRADVLSIFLSPLTRDEIIYLSGGERNVSIADFVADVMRRKLLRRTEKQKGILSLKDLENIERRAESAYSEMKEACYFDYVIPNHDGEDSENWNAFYYPIGDARTTLLAFAELVSGKLPLIAEKWDPGLLGRAL